MFIKPPSTYLHGNNENEIVIPLSCNSFTKEKTITITMDFNRDSKLRKAHENIRKLMNEFIVRRFRREYVLCLLMDK